MYCMKIVEDTIEWLEPYKLGNYQFFRQWAAESWVSTGGRLRKDIKLPWKLKMAIGKLGLVRRLPLMQLRYQKKLIVGVGGRPDYYCWPYNYTYEIVPVIWDCWPRYWRHLIRFLVRNDVKTVFCTSSQTADMVRKNLPNVNAVWLPEGIKVDAYPMGPRLVERSIDILEVGRLKSGLADLIESGVKNVSYVRPQRNEYLFRSFEELTAGIRDAKMVVCYPRSDTNNEIAQGVETLTQRYWECMLSGSLIIGHAPKELVRICGYNPVIELGDDPVAKVKEILSSIDSYQSLVDKNRAFAETNASWDNRMHIIRASLIG